MYKHHTYKNARLWWIPHLAEILTSVGFFLLMRLKHYKCSAVMFVSRIIPAAKRSGISDTVVRSKRSERGLVTQLSRANQTGISDAD